MPVTSVRAQILYAWRGSSLLIVTPRGECAPRETLSGFYYREARFLRTLQLKLNGVSPWLCEAAQLDPHQLAFAYAHPELGTFGGGGTGQSGDEESVDGTGTPHRALAIHVHYTVQCRGLTVRLVIANHARRHLACDMELMVDADFVDIQDAFPGGVTPRAAIDHQIDGDRLSLIHRHDQLPFESIITVEVDQPAAWRATVLESQLHLAPQQAATLSLRLEPRVAGAPADNDGGERERYQDEWASRFTRVSVPGNRVAERIVTGNVRDFA